MILKLKRTPGIYLVGFMGSGKSTVGVLLADHIGWKFVDLDEQIELRESQRVSEIFDQRGEPEFRRIEHEMMKRYVRDVECGHPVVLALGGGAFVQPENYALLENNGVTLWLDCPFDVIEHRIGNATNRPLARDRRKLRELYDARRAAYSLADYHVESSSDDPQVTLAAMLQLPPFH